MYLTTFRRVAKCTMDGLARSTSILGARQKAVGIFSNFPAQWDAHLIFVTTVTQQFLKWRRWKDFNISAGNGTDFWNGGDGKYFQYDENGIYLWNGGDEKDFLNGGNGKDFWNGGDGRDFWNDGDGKWWQWNRFLKWWRWKMVAMEQISEMMEKIWQMWALSLLFWPCVCQSRPLLLHLGVSWSATKRGLIDI